MWLHHWQQLSPICPACLQRSAAENPLSISQVVQQISTEHGEDLIEGLLQCTDSACAAEFPVIDGIPILVPQVRDYIQQHWPSLTARDDLSPILQSVFTDCCGPGSVIEQQRFHMSSYVWDHFGEFDVEGGGSGDGSGALARLLAELVDLEAIQAGHSVWDSGAATGRVGWQVARQTGAMVLCSDLNFTFLKAARDITHKARVSYSRRRLGLVYESREFEIPQAPMGQLDYWVMDAMFPALSQRSVSHTMAFNLLDCVPSPVQLLQQWHRVSTVGGRLNLTTPFDWSPTATPLESWIGGHSERAEGHGQCEEILASLWKSEAHAQSLDGVKILRRVDDIAWQVRIHQRSCMQYSVQGWCLSLSG